jgi:hypothetical protein
MLRAAKTLWIARERRKKSETARLVASQRLPFSAIVF